MNRGVKNKGNKHVLMVIVLILSIFIVSSPEIKGLLYPGDNIKIHVMLSVNNQEISIDHSNITLRNDGRDVTIAAKNGELKARGKEYGEFHFEIVIDSDNIPNYDKDIVINLRYINSNNWYISESECRLLLNTFNSGTISGESTVEVKYNDGTTSSKYNQNIETKNNEVTINWGI